MVVKLDSLFVIVRSIDDPQQKMFIVNLGLNSDISTFIIWTSVFYWELNHS